MKVGHLYVLFIVISTIIVLVNTCGLIIGSILTAFIAFCFQSECLESFIYIKPTKAL